MDISIAALRDGYEKENESDSLKRLWVLGNNGEVGFMCLTCTIIITIMYPCFVHVALLMNINSAW